MCNLVDKRMKKYNTLQRKCDTSLIFIHQSNEHP